MPSSARPSAVALSTSRMRTVIEQHAENAAFLWTQRERVAGSHVEDFEHLCLLDARLEAHIDGLRIAGDLGFEVCEELIAEGDAGELFAATATMLAVPTRARFEPLLALAASDPLRARGLASALAWSPSAAANELTTVLWSSEDSARRRLACSVDAARRELSADNLERAAADPDASLRARALRAAGEVGASALRPLLRASAQFEDDPSCGLWAAWSAALLGDRSDVTLARLREAARLPLAGAARACALWARCVAPSEALPFLAELADQPAHQRGFAIAAAALGLPELVPMLLSLMQLEAVSRLAGWAFTAITGVDLAQHALIRPAEETPQTGPNEEPEDERVDLDIDDGLPWPEPARVERSWAEHSARFRAQTRHQQGTPMTQETTQRTLRHGSQLLRQLAAEERLLSAPKSGALFNVRGPASSQRAALAGTRS